MNLSFIAACLWVFLASATGLLPTRDHHWRAAYLLIAVGIPILGWVTYDSGPVLGLVVLAAGASILRWPVIYLWRWGRRKTRGGRGEVGHVGLRGCGGCPEGAVDAKQGRPTGSEEHKRTCSGAIEARDRSDGDGANGRGLYRETSARLRRVLCLPPQDHRSHSHRTAVG